MRLLPRILLPLMLAAGCGAADADYLFGFIRTAPNARPMAPEERQRLQGAHMAHIGDMASAGALVAAGPVVRSPNLRGIFIFKGESKARELSAADPYVKAGELVVEVYPWRGPAGIGERYAAEEKSNPRFKPKMIQVQMIVLRDGDPRGALRRLRSTGKVLAAGELKDAAALRAVCVLQAGSKEAAQAMMDADADVKAGKLAAEVHQWMVADLVLPEPR